MPDSDWTHKWFDWIFGNGPLKQAAATGDAPKNTPPPAQPANLDIAKMAQQQADQAQAAKKADPNYESQGPYVRGAKK